jgi:uncharacterized protein YlxW (UPF0749 family)
MEGELRDDPAVPDVPPRRRRLRPATVLVAVTALAAGLLFATSARTSQGTDLRAGRGVQLVQLVARQQDELARQEQEAAALRGQVARAQASAAARDAGVAKERTAAAPVAEAAGLTPVRGPALTVRLDDAPRVSGVPAASDNPDDLVVHQQDVQSVVNALWAGGAEAVRLMDQRIVSTSAVRCVGNTLILQGRVYSPPFVVTAVGDVGGMRGALDAEPGVALFREYVDRFGLGYDVRGAGEVTLPAYDGPLELPHVVPTP